MDMMKFIWLKLLVAARSIQLNSETFPRKVLINQFKCMIVINSIWYLLQVMLKEIVPLI